MRELFELEPRDAGTQVVEPAIAFDEVTTGLHDRSRCVGCCEEHTNIDLITHSVTQ
ncbi:hypothetical protein [Actinospica robiniae]|uniref:hypothetical protein n=1 Tax=Actinospica robiniae TaxID=304901 RepID=UPI0003FA50EF|nr:hypothetical protein [Actinospica robiniae]